MPKKTKQERKDSIIARINEGTKGKRTIMEDNIMDIEVLAEETIRIEDLIMEFKQGAISEETVDSVLSQAESAYNDAQLHQSVNTLAKCIIALEEFDTVLADIIPVIATINAIIIKQAELAELREAINV